MLNPCKCSTVNFFLLFWNCCLQHQNSAAVARKHVQLWPKHASEMSLWTHSPPGAESLAAQFSGDLWTGQTLLWGCSPKAAHLHVLPGTVYRSWKNKALCSFHFCKSKMGTEDSSAWRAQVRSRYGQVLAENIKMLKRQQHWENVACFLCCFFNM